MKSVENCAQRCHRSSQFHLTDSQQQSVKQTSDTQNAPPAVPSVSNESLAGQNSQHLRWRHLIDHRASTWHFWEKVAAYSWENTTCTDDQTE